MSVLLIAANPKLLLLGVSLFAAMLLLLLIAVALRFGVLWFQCYMSGADVTLLSLIGMSLRRVDPGLIVTTKIMGKQAGLDTTRAHAVQTADLEAHVLAGGDIMLVVRAIIAANRAGIDLEFERAAAIDLAGRDVMEAVRTSVSPKVIDCPDERRSGSTAITAVAKDGVELKIHARVTVRTNLDQLIGGATEETIIARIGQGIITVIGSSATHMEVMATPDLISRQLLKSGLDSNTAFEIVSIDIANISIGDNIGARLQSDQAEADTRIARAAAEARLAEANAHTQEMKARTMKSRAELVLAEAEIPLELANAFRRGQMLGSNQVALRAVSPPISPRGRAS